MLVYLYVSYLEHTIQKIFMSKANFLDRLLDVSEMKMFNHATRPNLACYDEFHASILEADSFLKINHATL
jgi:hypothetical protein